MSALVLSVATEELSATAVVSTATLVESFTVVASVDPPLQEDNAKEATKESKKIDFFMVSFFCLLICEIYIPVGSLSFEAILKKTKNFSLFFFYLHNVSAIEIDQGDRVLYLASIPIVSINPTAALNKVLD